MPTPRESILSALQSLLATDPFFPPAAIDEPEPSEWIIVGDTPSSVAPPPAFAGRLFHACAVQDGPPPTLLATARGGGDADELELEAAVAYAVRADLAAGQTQGQARAVRRARRDRAVQRLADLIAANRTLGLGVQVWAELAPAQRDDDIAFPHASACATAVIPVRILYAAAHAAG